ADGPRQLLYTLAGMIGAAGLNEEGIGININYLSSNDCQAGKLHAVIVRQALSGRNLADAVKAATVGPRAGGSHYLLSDDTGNVVSVETSATRFALAYADGKPFGHTNHYSSDWMQPVSVVRPSAVGSSIARYTALRRFLLQDNLTGESLKAMTRSHVSYPRSICAHGSPDEPEESRGATVAAMVQSLSERTMEICDGCPCEGEYVRLEL
ncbi:MAG: acyl-CoA--6-aminopenicillanic acid acyl-transferase, partial [Planctomycetaceae bacterium]|nr:acyl-CoA--6-aminopenicillanic acid acyl-transferase [Planctomycetaceae bacterium]